MSPLVLGIAVLGGPAAWTVHLLVCYFLVALQCTSAWRGAVAGIVAVTAVCAAASAASGYVAWRHWPPPRGVAQALSEIEQPRGRDRFLMLVGMALAALFTLAIVVEALAPLFVPTCEALPGGGP